MSEDEKEKLQPFAEYLRPDEEILWQYASRVAKPRQADDFSPVSVICFVGSLGPMILISALKPTSTLAYAFVLLAPILAITALYYMRHRYRTRPESFIVSACAVTNQRLLNRSDETVIDLSLEEIPTIGISVGKGKGREDFSLLYFGDSFPAWAYMPDARAVKSIIEQAQKKRMQRL